jgi:hypothetical protein
MANETENIIQPALSEIAPVAAEPKVLSPAAQRALAEAAERRKLLVQQEAALAASKEINGRGGKDPVRYSDWEVKGIAIDF